VADAILRCGATPVLVDVRLPGGEIDMDLALAALSSQTRAVIVPHLYGIPVELDRTRDELAERSVVLIEDCAHCPGASVGDAPAGSLGSYSIFSIPANR
jgi:dTDP-4-amino-4,6-dideoxygalactose transaminase